MTLPPPVSPPGGSRPPVPFSPLPLSSSTVSWHERRLWQITPVRDLFWTVVIAVAAVLAIWIGFELRAVFTPVLIALALAYLFDPLISAAERRWSVPRPVTIATVLLLVVALLAALGTWAGPKMLQQARDLTAAAPAYLERLTQWAEVQLSEETLAPLRQLEANPGGFLADKAAAILMGTGVAFGLIGNVIGKTMLVLVTIGLVPIYFFFFAWNFGPMTRQFEQYLPRSRRERVMQIVGRMDRIVATYFRARVVIAVIMGVLLSIGWGIVGVKYWLLLGMVSGLLSLIPYASIVGWPLAVGLTWLAVTGGPDPQPFDAMRIVVWPSVVYIAVQLIESWLLTPLIQGRSLEMSVVTVLIVVFIGGAAGGLYGLILAIPLAACIKVLLVELVLPRVRQWAAAN